MTQEDIIKSAENVEEYILQQMKFKQKHDKNMKTLRKDKQCTYGWFIDNEKNNNYGIDFEKTDYNFFISSADCHYFVGRALMLNEIYLYSLFCAQQCVENYLKAYLKFLKVEYNKKNYDEHNLKVLLNNCKKYNIKDDFVKSVYIEVICDMFNPYYEKGRYPVYKNGPPKNKGYCIAAGGETCLILDYFVYKMREILMPNKKGVFENGCLDLVFCENDHPKFYEKYLKGANAFIL